MNDGRNLQNELTTLETLINSKKSDIKVRKNELASVINPIRKRQLEKVVKSLNVELNLLEKNYNNLKDRINTDSVSSNKIEQEKLESMSVMDALKYFITENSSTKKFLIIQNMTVEQIIYLIDNIENPLLYINSIEKNKLIDVFNNLSFNSIKKIFDKNLKKNQFDVFEKARDVLINKLKSLGLKSETIGYFKAIGYDDFNDETNVNEKGNIKSIKDANEEKNIIKSQLNSYLKKLKDIEKLEVEELNKLLNDNVLEELSDRLNKLIKSNIDKNDLSNYVSLFTAILDIYNKIESSKEEKNKKIQKELDKKRNKK